MDDNNSTLPEDSSLNLDQSKTSGSYRSVSPTESGLNQEKEKASSKSSGYNKAEAENIKNEDIYEQSLYEKNGKFYLVGSEDSVAPGRNKTKYSNNRVRKTSNARNGSASRYSNGKRTENSSRSQSAHRPGSEHVSYQAIQLKSETYKLTDEQRKQLAAENRERRLRELEEQKRQNELEQQRSENSNKAFQSWLKKKQQEKKNQKIESPDTGRSNSKENVSNDGFSYENWLKSKRKQRNEEERMNKVRAEMQSSMKHTPEECQAAYRKWLKRKQEEEKLQLEIEKCLLSHYRVHGK